MDSFVQKIEITSTLSTSVFFLKILRKLLLVSIMSLKVTPGLSCEQLFIIADHLAKVIFCFGRPVQTFKHWKFVLKCWNSSLVEACAGTRSHALNFSHL